MSAKKDSTSKISFRTSNNNDLSKVQNPKQTLKTMETSSNSYNR